MRVESWFVGSRGQIISRSQISLNQKPNQVFSSSPRIVIGRRLPLDTYAIRVRVLSQAGKIIAEDSFAISVKQAAK